ncbi:prepilin-type N-terminal cleavage/methylation domain-containing protein [Thiotrichales bacterium 19S11-10]|nr:prepilin-type N-terminal cleavage/methylation domain-containing protein [Thiotrichales bacterium 19S11-10]
MLKINNEYGFTLTELLVTLAISLFVIGVFLSFFSVTNTTSISQSRSLAATTNIEKIIESLSLGLRRAGFWEGADTMVSQGRNTNPFMQKETNLQTSTDENCVLYSYDLNKDSKLPSLETSTGDERFGFRLFGQTLQMRPATLGSFSCDTSKNDWIDLTDPDQVRIDQFQVRIITNDTDLNTLDWKVSPKIRERVVQLKLAGSNKGNVEQKFNIDKLIVVKNDEFIAGVK